MADFDVICVKCNTKMEEGMLIVHNWINFWVAGTPPNSMEKVWWGLPIKRKRRVPTRTFRCTACGYLEVYAK